MKNLWVMTRATAVGYYLPHLRCSGPSGVSSLALKSTDGIFSSMSTVADIENAVQKLSRQDLTAFRDWFLGFDATAWDKQFEEDVAAGRLDALADEALRDLREGRCTDL
jgi:hypothetical protein